MTDQKFGTHVADASMTHQIGSGVQHKFKFPNGYGASVVRFVLEGGFGGSYGSEQGLWELAVLDKSDRLTYETPITDDVLGYLSDADVAEALDKIAARPWSGAAS